MPTAKNSGRRTALLHLASDLLLEIDSEGVVVFANTAFHDATGITDAVGHQFAEWLDDSDGIDFPSHLTQTRSSGDRLFVRLRLRAGAGDLRYVFATGERTQFVDGGTGVALALRFTDQPQQTSVMRRFESGADVLLRTLLE